jgi:hypothetical protein
MPSCGHISHDADSLNPQRIGIDIGLGEMVLVILQPEEEVILEGKRLNGCTDG